MRTTSLIRSTIAATAVFLSASSNTEAWAHGHHSAMRLVPLANLAADVTSLSVYGPTPNGVRVDVAFKGELHGRIDGTMEGIDYSTVRSDGVTALSVRAKVVTVDQALIAVEITGTMQNGEITDTQVKFLTAAPQYSWLTDKIIVGRGEATTEKLTVSYFLVE